MNLYVTTIYGGAILLCLIFSNISISFSCHQYENYINHDLLKGIRFVTKNKIFNWRQLDKIGELYSKVKYIFIYTHGFVFHEQYLSVFKECAEIGMRWRGGLLFLDWSRAQNNEFTHYRIAIEIGIALREVMNNSFLKENKSIILLGHGSGANLMGTLGKGLKNFPYKTIGIDPLLRNKLIPMPYKLTTTSGYTTEILHTSISGNGDLSPTAHRHFIWDAEYVSDLCPIRSEERICLHQLGFELYLQCGAINVTYAVLCPKLDMYQKQKCQGYPEIPVQNSINISVNAPGGAYYFSLAKATKQHLGTRKEKLPHILQ